MQHLRHSPDMVSLFLSVRYPRCLLNPPSLSPLNPSVYVCSYRFAGRPGDYVYIFGDYRMEEVRAWSVMMTT